MIFGRLVQSVANQLVAGKIMVWSQASGGGGSHCFGEYHRVMNQVYVLSVPSIKGPLGLVVLLWE